MTGHCWWKYSWTPLCWTRLSRTPCYLKLLLSPLGSNQPRLSRTLLRSKETLVNISQEVQSRHLLTRCTESWKMLVTKAKSDWLDLLLRMQTATSCRNLLILGIKLLLQKFDPNLAISNHRYLELFFDTLEIPLGVQDSGVQLYAAVHNVGWFVLVQL